jgi:hypothetical protein
VEKAGRCPQGRGAQLPCLWPHLLRATGDPALCRMELQGLAAAAHLALAELEGPPSTATLRHRTGSAALRAASTMARGEVGRRWRVGGPPGCYAGSRRRELEEPGLA